MPSHTPAERKKNKPRKKKAKLKKEAKRNKRRAGKQR